MFGGGPPRNKLTLSVRIRSDRLARTAAFAANSLAIDFNRFSEPSKARWPDHAQTQRVRAVSRIKPHWSRGAKPGDSFDEIVTLARERDSTGRQAG